MDGAYPLLEVKVPDWQMQWMSDGLVLLLAPLPHLVSAIFAKKVLKQGCMHEGRLATHLL
jgi:hypothetical protein